MFKFFSKTPAKCMPKYREYFVSHGTMTTSIFANGFELNLHERHIIFYLNREIVSVFTDLKSFYVVGDEAALEEKE